MSEEIIPTRNVLDDGRLTRLTYIEEPCALCEEPVTWAHVLDRAHRVGGLGGNRFAHRECLLRSGVGGIGHCVNHAQWCLVRHDPDAGLTYRQSALMVDDWIAEGNVPHC